jgi:hypothetical protein
MENRSGRTCVYTVAVSGALGREINNLTVQGKELTEG